MTGWELWLCGESDGPLFVPTADGEEADVATAFDKSADVASVVKKAVPASRKVDVDVLVKAGYRKQQVEQDPVNQVNTVLAVGSDQVVCLSNLLQRQKSWQQCWVACTWVLAIISAPSGTQPLKATRLVTDLELSLLRGI